MGQLSKVGVALAVAALVIVGGTTYALASAGGSTISVCVGHKGGVLYQAHRCAKHDTKLSWSKQGLQGQPGSRGPQGVQGIQGVKGDSGQTGPPGPTTTTAPSGSTQTGTVEAVGVASGAGQYVAGTSISFALQLTSAPTVVEVPWATTNPNCPGTTAAPAAHGGYLCIYIRNDTNVNQVIANDDFYPQEAGNLDFGASRFGVLLTADSKAAGIVEAVGSWAATAP